MEDRTQEQPPVGTDLKSVPRKGGQEERDYTRKVYQNLMEIVELLEKKAPLPMTQRQISEATGISKNVVFDVCWNMCRRGWAEEVGDGSVRLKKSTNEKDAWVGRMVVRAVRDAYGIKGGEYETSKT